MIIKELKIDSFGALKNREYELSEGLNIIEGANESGKSTIAMFIKFMLYGLSGRRADGEIPDKSRYASWDTGMASGSMILEVGGNEYRIEREYFSYSDAVSSGDSSKDKCSVTDLATGEKVFRNEVPGMALLGIPEQLFVNTVFVKQLSDARIDGNGTADAMENILMSGDEGVSTKKAIERLEKERISLKHKNGTGGLVTELQREVLRLRQKLEEATGESADIIALESSVEELGNTVSQREKESEYLDRLCELYDRINAKRKRDEACKYAQEIGEIDKKLSEYDTYGNLTEAIKEIVELSAAVKSTQERQKILRKREMELDSELPPLMSGEDVEAALTDVEDAKKAHGKIGKNIFWGIVLFLFGGGLIAADVLINPPYHSVFLSTAAVLLIVAAILITSGIRNSSKYKRIISDWGVRGTGELEKTVKKRIKQASQRTDPGSEYSMTVSALRQAEAERISLTTDLRSCLSVFTYDISDTEIMTDNAMRKARQIEKERDELESRRNEAYGRYSALADAFDDGTDDTELPALMLTDAGRAASRMTREEAETARRKQKFAENSLPSLRTQLSEKETRLSVLKATTPDPAAISANLETVEKQLNEATERYESIVLAIDSLTAAGDQLRRSLVPRVKAEAERIIGNFTGGKYTALGVDRRFDMTFDTGGRTRDAVYFSAGTRDIAYISLRMALAHVLFSYNVPPVIYDESFARVDEGRLRRILSFLESAGADGSQSLLFTCRKLEGEIASELSDVTVIRLN